MPATAGSQVYAPRNGSHGANAANIGPTRAAFGLCLPGGPRRLRRSEYMTISLSAERGERRRIADTTAFSIILALSFSHFLNDMMQSLLPALYPMLKGAYGLSFAQIGMIHLTSQLISSVLQPAVGLFADHRPQPYSLALRSEERR